MYSRGDIDAATARLRAPLRPGFIPSPRRARTASRSRPVHPGAAPRSDTKGRWDWLLASTTSTRASRRRRSATTRSRRQSARRLCLPDADAPPGRSSPRSTSGERPLDAQGGSATRPTRRTSRREADPTFQLPTRARSTFDRADLVTGTLDTTRRTRASTCTAAWARLPRPSIQGRSSSVPTSRVARTGDELRLVATRRRSPPSSGREDRDRPQAAAERRRYVYGSTASRSWRWAASTTRRRCSTPTRRRATASRQTRLGASARWLFTLGPLQHTEIDDPTSRWRLRAVHHHQPDRRRLARVDGNRCRTLRSGW